MKRQYAVKEIAYFIYSSGDLTNEFFSNHSSTDGTKAHKYLQRKYNEESQKEYYIKYIYNNDTLITGYIDGVLKENGTTILEEIKSTKELLSSLSLDYHLEHLAQLKLYAYMYINLMGLETINVRLTYIRISNYETKSFDQIFNKNELENFFLESIKKYDLWISLLEETTINKIDSIDKISFPFKEMRKGQRELMKATYYTMSNNEILYAIAPTGIGKTMATLFSSLKTMDSNDKLFYLTSKSTQKNICVDSVKLLMKQGLKLKTLVLTAKSKSCLNIVKSCNPKDCIYAKGFFNRLREAFDEIYSKYDLYTYDIIKEISIKHKICSFEFSLYLSYFCDLIICDYNYVFDPRAHLIRYFDDDTYNPKILIDEAHNLISRSKDMYSATITRNMILRVKEIFHNYSKMLYGIINSIIKLLDSYQDKINEELFFYSKFMDDGLINLLVSLKGRMEEIISDESEEINEKDMALELFFNIQGFLDIAELFNENYLFIIEKTSDDYIISLNCIDASEFLYETMSKKCHGITLFSATMYPIDYHMNLLSQGHGKFLTLESPFDIKNMDLIINTSISTKYQNREKSIDDIVLITKKLVESKEGNYIVFFPSYKYLQMFYDKVKDLPYNFLIQTSDMTEYDKNEMFDSFKEIEKNYLGLFVLGGSFSEGMDYVADLLSGVIIVGVGLPQINIYNNLTKEYFDEASYDGFNYAYTFPGFNKVIQAAGRVIRTEDDRGVVILIDERYRTMRYKSLFPHHWRGYKVINDSKELEIELKDFFKNE